MTYTPNPINTSDVAVPAAIRELTELLGQERPRGLGGAATSLFEAL